MLLFCKVCILILLLIQHHHDVESHAFFKFFLCNLSGDNFDLCAVDRFGYWTKYSFVRYARGTVLKADQSSLCHFMFLPLFLVQCNCFL